MRRVADGRCTVGVLLQHRAGRLCAFPTLPLYKHAYALLSVCERWQSSEENVPGGRLVRTTRAADPRVASVGFVNPG